jgi:hypothetical protein
MLVEEKTLFPVFPLFFYTTAALFIFQSEKVRSSLISQLDGFF